MKLDRREFLEAIKSKDVSLVNSLITAELAKCQDDDGTPMLTLASSLGLIEICKILLDHGADLETASPETGITPLLASAKNGHLDVYNFLVEKGALETACDAQGNSPLHLAASNGHVDMCKILPMEDLNSKNSKGATPLILATKEGHHEVCRMLIEKGADMSIVDTSDKSALMHAAWFGDLKMSSLLIENHADVKQEEGNRTALHYACRADSEEVVKLLLREGADPTAGGVWTPLHVAAGYAGPGVAASLLDAGADINAVSIASVRLRLLWLTQRHVSG